MSHEEELELDRILLQRSAAGEREAFLEFMKRHQDAVFRFCRALTERVEDAEDALQETFVAAWQHAGGFRGVGSARSWLFTTARRNVYRAVRRERPEAHGDVAELDRLAVEAGWGCRQEDSDRIDLQRAFDRLSASDRQILILRELEGLSNAETAEVLGIELRAAKSRLHRARLRLVASLTRGGRDEG